MAFTRRTFLGGSALAALTGCGNRPAPLPPVTRGRRDPRPLEAKVGSAGQPLDGILARALDTAKKLGASYADVRVVRRRSESIATREDHVVGVEYGETYGLGVRVIVDGAWGFASSETVDLPAAESAATNAVAIARAAKSTLKHPVELAPAPSVTGTWRTKMDVDPFEVPLADKAQFLLDLWPLVKDVALVKYATAGYDALAEWKVLASSEGSRVEQSITRVYPHLTVTAVDKGEFESRRSEVPPMQAGWEYVLGARLKEDARRLADDAVKKLKSPSVTAGKKDLVLAPSNLWLTIHESVGHPTELDRALGLEADLAGTSFATTDKLGKLRYGAPIVTLYADKTTPGGLATCGWDDDGVATQRWNLVEKGLFVGYQTTRDQAAWIGEKSSRGTSYAQDHRSVAFQRMPNVSLLHGEKETSLDDIVAATDDGVLITGDGSWSIDHQRYNFQFSGQMFYAIKGGKIAGTLKDVAYQSNSLEFWNSCDMIGGEKAWQLHGTLWDGKGEPGQSNAVSHGCPPARFRGVNVLNVNARGKK
jgi:TldD protein